MKPCTRNTNQVSLFWLSFIMEFKQLIFCTSSEVKFNWLSIVFVGLSKKEDVKKYFGTWGVEHFNHTFRPLPIVDAYPGSIPPLIPSTVRSSGEVGPRGAKVSNWNFVSPRCWIPGAIAIVTLEGVRSGRGRRTWFNNLNRNWYGKSNLSQMKLIKYVSPRCKKVRKLQLQPQTPFLLLGSYQKSSQFETETSILELRADRNSQVRQCLGFRTAGFCLPLPMNQLNKKPNIT